MTANAAARLMAWGLGGVVVELARFQEHGGLVLSRASDPGARHEINMGIGHELEEEQN